MLTAIIFDLDGTLANTDPLHYQTWVDVLSDYGMKLNPEFYNARISGRLNPDIVRDILPQLTPEEGRDLADRKEARFREIALGLEPLPGLMELLAWIEKKGLKTGIVTNAPRANAVFMLEVLKLGDRFEHVILSEEVGVGKPDPAPYKTILDRLDVSPTEAIVFEDSPSGIRAAVAAGIETFGVASTHDPGGLKQAGATRVIDNFEDWELWQYLQSAIG
ncbi:HAD family phosphatase [Lyngbya sp. CCY1209]|uniref:HAD family hydrolase n=1 Tax=Lyngbya sp. CCY1209 TaxID=2886103 RepID=UPI002D204F65|nr:HAD family phosphatase [Lyngbya sp. CCY1209]MEB3887033.1 HAD family phosphatase [Lyngbya sp. CCY1209]